MLKLVQAKSFLFIFLSLKLSPLFHKPVKQLDYSNFLNDLAQEDSISIRFSPVLTTQKYDNINSDDGAVWENAMVYLIYKQVQTRLFLNPPKVYQ